MNGNKEIGILIVEDHYLVRMGIKALISTQPDMVILAEAENGHEAVDMFHTHRPDITLLDLRIPGIGGVEVITAIRKSFPNARIIVLTNYEGNEDIYRSLQAGAKSYLQKDVMGEELLAVIRKVVAGKNYIPQDVAARLGERITRSDLSAREMEVLKLMVKGMSNKEIAQALLISDGTVRLHVSNILAKLGVSDRTNAVAMALLCGIIHPEQDPT